MLLITVIGLNAQTYSIPKNYSFKTSSDYITYQDSVLKCIDALLNTSPEINPAERKKANFFLLQWMSGSPAVSIAIKSEIVTFGKNPDLLMVFMCGWTKYVLQSNDNKNQIMGNQKGVEAVIDFYLKFKDQLKSDKSIDKYIQLQKEGKLTEFIQKNM